MQQAREAVSSANANPREAGDRAGDAVDALNCGGAWAAPRPRRRERVGVGVGPGRGDGADGAAGEAAGPARRAGRVADPADGRGRRAQQQLQQLAAQQRALAQELEKLRGQGNMPGAGEMADEAEELAQRLEAGRLDRQTVERQERLFRRMLDAGRTLQGEQEDEQKERQSTTATGDSVLLPPALRARLAG